MSVFFRQPSSLTGRKAAKNPDFDLKLRHMGLPLSPLVQVNTGLVHPAFPKYLVNFWLLTDDQLEALAGFYHQRVPCAWTCEYPLPVVWPAGMSLEQKRRKFGRFIGLRGCESPAFQAAGEDPQAAFRRQDDEEVIRKTQWYY
jgi:hypothetical protein